MNKLRSRYLAFLVLVSFMVQPIVVSVAHAGFLSNFASSQRGLGGYQRTYAGFYQNAESGYRGVIGGTFIFPAEATVGIEAGFDFDFSASCMGMDFNAEAFANVKLAQIVEWLRGLLISFAFTYIIGLATASPTVKNALDSAKNLGHGISKMLQSPCELGSKFGSDVLEKGFESFANCVSDNIDIGLVGSRTESYDSCMTAAPKTFGAADYTPSEEKSVLTECGDKFVFDTVDRDMLTAVLEGAGWKKSAQGKVTIKDQKSIDFKKEYEALYVKNVATFKALVTQVITTPPGGTLTLTAAQIKDGSGPVIGFYAKDIRNIRIVGTKNKKLATQLGSDLGEAMAIGEAKLTFQRLTELLAKCEGVGTMSPSMKDSLRSINEHIQDFLVNLSSTKEDKKTQRDIPQELEKEAARIINAGREGSMYKISGIGG